MNESPNNAPPAAPHDVVSTPAASASQPFKPVPGPTGPKRAWLRRPSNILLLILFLLLAAQWWHTQTELKELRRETAQRLQAGEAAINETRTIAKTVQEGTRQLQGKVSVMENKQVEAQSQQLALEQLYQDLSRNRDDWALAEIEQVLSTASQQLQLSGNVRGALIALQNADSRLALSDKPQFISIRRALALDMDKLKALPSVDLTGLALRLDSIIGQIDGMPLLADEKPSSPMTQPKNTRRAAIAEKGAKGVAASGSVASEWIAALQDTWQSFSTELWSELRQLIRVRTVDTPEALLLSPTEAYYARENLKLRLLNARLALLSRNESAFRSDLIAAQDTIGKYFDTRARQTQAAQALLRQVQGSNLAIEMPTLADSLTAVRNFKAKP